MRLFLQSHSPYFQLFAPQKTLGIPDNACIKIREQLREYFGTLAPPELVSAYTALQEALNSLKNIEEELKKVITALQKASNKE
jgi:hypothetical protein